MIEITVKHGKDEEAIAAVTAMVIAQAIELDLGHKVPITGWNRAKLTEARMGRMKARRQKVNFRVRYGNA